MSTSLFYCQESLMEKHPSIITCLENYSKENSIAIYAIDKPQSESKYSYHCDFMIVLIPGHKVLILFFDSNQKLINGTLEDLVEDLSSLADRYDYISILGRSRIWRHEALYIQEEPILPINIPSLIMDNTLPPALHRKIELLISLFIGSVNDPSKLRVENPVDILEKTRQRIILFDGDQTRFLHIDDNSKKVIKVIGLSGSGKTELLLHKLMLLYNRYEDCKIMFACHNMILANSLKDHRIPNFLDIMKFPQQIKWNERLFCTYAWGSKKNRVGVYYYICQYYGIEFKRFNYEHTSLKSACEDAIKDLIKSDLVKMKGHALGILLLDEGQDLPKAFIDLCEMVTSEKIYVAFDIFQNIFEPDIRDINPDFFLTNCYRTHPHTLLFAHAIALGLFEEKKLRWLSEEALEACGYSIEKNINTYKLRRTPIKRFEDDFDDNFSSIEIIDNDNQKHDNSASVIVNIIKKIQNNNPTATINDIGIIFTNNKRGKQLSKDTELLIKKEFNWILNRAYDSKSIHKDTLLFSNQNNVKGLEYPFIICVPDEISDDLIERNILYMMLTRSLVQTFLVIPKTTDRNLVKILKDGWQQIKTYGYIETSIPTPEEQERIRTNISSIKGKLIFNETIKGLLIKYNIKKRHHTSLQDFILYNTNSDTPIDKIEELILAFIAIQK
ncbi:MAG: DNA helicase [Oligoflexia bacterium]|nr:DNA helicase [Oligoflexia bacterium]